MGLAGAGSADEHRVALLGEEGTGSELVDHGFIDRRALERSL